MYIVYVEIYRFHLASSLLPRGNAQNVTKKAMRKRTARMLRRLVPVTCTQIWQRWPQPQKLALQASLAKGLHGSSGRLGAHPIRYGATDTKVI